MGTRRNKSRRPANPIAEPGLTPMQRALLEEASRKVTIVVDGQQSEVSVGQVVSRKLMQMAANGSVHALSNAFNETVLGERQQEAEIKKEVAFGHQYKAHQQELFDCAIKNGLDPDTVLPHPDDIVVVEGEGYRIIGPENEVILNFVKGTCARRDLLILQYVLEERLQPTRDPGPRNGADGDDETVAHSSALLLVYFMNDGLPERFRLTDLDIERAIWRHQRKTKRNC